jgi:hypothetical protein
MNCLRSLGSKDRGFESHLGHGCLVFVCMCAFFCVCVVLCLGRGLATSWSPVQGVLPSGMIKKLRNQPYAPKWEQAPKWERRGKQNTMIKRINPLAPAFREISVCTMSDFTGTDGPTLRAMRHHSELTLSVMEEIWKFLNRSSPSDL